MPCKEAWMLVETRHGESFGVSEEDIALFYTKRAEMLENPDL